MIIKVVPHFLHFLFIEEIFIQTNRHQNVLIYSRGMKRDHETKITCNDTELSSRRASGAALSYGIAALCGGLPDNGSNYGRLGSGAVCFDVPRSLGDARVSLQIFEYKSRVTLCINAILY